MPLMTFKQKQNKLAYFVCW